MKPVLLILIIMFSVSVLPALLAAAPYDRSGNLWMQMSSTQLSIKLYQLAKIQKKPSNLCEKYPCLPVGCGVWTKERESKWHTVPYRHFS